MVLPYGGTFRACMQYVREAVAKKIADGMQNPFGDQLGKATAFLAKLVWASISDVVVAARVAMDWLQKVARIAAKHGPSRCVAHAVRLRRAPGVQRPHGTAP
jgi:DNA-directed RNA polymerase